MKSCPSCQRTYDDDALSFCLEDGTPLVGGAGGAVDTGATMKIPAARLTSDAPTEVMSAEEQQQVAPTQAAPPSARPTPPPPPQYNAPTPAAPAARKSSAAPWILGAAVVLGLSAIAVALLMTRGGAGGSEIAQQAPQSDNTNLNANSFTLPASEPGLEDTNNMAVNPTGSPGSTPASVTPGTTPGQPSATPRLSPTPRATASSPPPREAEEPPPPPAPTQTPRRTPISGGVLNGKAISLPKPPYPAIARAARASGTVNVQVTVDEGGKVISARAVGGHPLLQQAAVQAAYGARFSPTQLSGQPVKVTGIITYNFVAQ